MSEPLPDIVAYAEYRLYLKDRYEAIKARDAKFSHRYINGKAGVKSSGWISDIPAGRQRPRPKRPSISCNASVSSFPSS